MSGLNHLIRFLFWGVLVKLVVNIVLGINIRRQELLPTQGPAIIVANHNSHLDTIVLMSLYSHARRRQVRPAAASDHFLTNRFLAWLSVDIIGIAPVERQVSRGSNPLQACQDVLDRNEILILYPEGSRGQPEQLAEFKAGIARLAQSYPDVPITPVFMHGLGKALPRNEAILVPFFCDIFVGEALCWPGNKQEFMQTLTERFAALSKEKTFAAWE